LSQWDTADAEIEVPSVENPELTNILPLKPDVCLNEWEGYSNRFLRLYATLLPENLRKHCREWPAGKTEAEIKLLIQENRKPQDLIVYTDGLVTKDQSGWGFTVKQGATTIHEDSAASQVARFSEDLKC